MRHLSAVLIAKNLAGIDDIFSLTIIKPNGFDVRFQTLLPETWDGRGFIRDLEQSPRHFVDANIGRLSRKDHRHQQLEWRSILQLGGRMRSLRLEPIEDLGTLVAVQ